MSTSDLPPLLFDRRQVRDQRQRVAEHFHEFAILEPQIAERMADRLAGINRVFSHRLEIGCAGFSTLPEGRDRTVHCDLAAGLLQGHDGVSVVGDEELLPFGAATFDLVLSSLTLHWVNDLPGTLVQIKNILQPDGLLLAALLGGQSLHELRHAVTEAELEVSGGAATRISPFADIRDLGDLLQRAGFAMPVADLDRITIGYRDIFDLLRDLKGSGNSNALAGRETRPPGRQLFHRAGEIYRERFADPDGLLPATFDVVFLTAWAPGPGQPEPKRPGSATHSLADALSAKRLKED
jgi:SAM-dependent methyltransferase